MYLSHEKYDFEKKVPTYFLLLTYVNCYAHPNGLCYCNHEAGNSRSVGSHIQKNGDFLTFGTSRFYAFAFVSLRRKLHVVCLYNERIS